MDNGYCSSVCRRCQEMEGDCDYAFSGQRGSVLRQMACLEKKKIPPPPPLPSSRTLGVDKREENTNIY